MKLLVTGSRNITDLEFVTNCLDTILVEGTNFNDIIQGGARGVDNLVKKYCLKRGIYYYTYSAEWDVYGKSAGPIRNNKMVEVCDGGIAIWDGKSKGTKQCMSALKNAGKLLEVFMYDK